MEHSLSVATIASVIQLAVTPVFLMAGIAGILNVMSVRLGRIVDRARVVERQITFAADEPQRYFLQQETTSLWRRIRMINWSIRAGISAALMGCLVVVTLFIGEFVDLNLYGLIGGLFVIAMLCMIASPAWCCCCSR